MRLSRLESSLLRCSRGPFLSPPGDDGGGGGNGGGGEEIKPKEGEEGDGGEGGGNLPQTDAEFAAWKESTRKHLTAEIRRTVKADLDAERTRADAEAQRQREADEAAAKGDFETAKQQLTTDLTAAQGERDTLKTENDALREAMKVGVEAQWKELPAALQLAGKFIAEEDVLGRWTYLNDPDVQKQIKEAGKERNRGNGADPNPNGTGRPELKPLINVKQAIG